MSLLTALILFSSGPTPATAQEFGQWWWEAVVGTGQRSTDNLQNGSRTSEFDERDLRLAMALNGYLGHPVLGNFRVQVDLLTSRIESGRDTDSDRAGFDADLDLLPRGAYPLHLFARTRLYDYSGAASADRLSVLRSPDSSTEWGGRFRVRQGALGGLQLGFDQSTTEFIDPDSRETVHGRQFLDWARVFDRFQHHVRLDHRLADFGTADLKVEDLSFNVEERADITPAWRWEMSGTGIRRDSETTAAPTLTTDTYRLFNRFLHTIRNRDRLDIQTHTGLVRPDSQPSLDSHGMSVFYRWRPRPGLEIAPFGQYAEQSSDSLEVRSPRLGSGLSWNRQTGLLDTLLSARASYGVVDQSDATESRDESQFAFGVTGTLGHGHAKGLRKELELEVARNELRFDRNPVLDLPDLGLAQSGLGTEDFRRARFGLSHRWDSRSIGGWGEWNSRESSDGVQSFDFETDTYTATLQHDGPSYDISTSAGQTRVDQGPLGRQEISYHGAAASWRPWRLLRVWGSYRSDTRDVTVTPDIDGQRIQAGVSVRVGQLAFEASTFETRDRPDGGPERRNEGFNWSVTRRFSGWLPIVTGSNPRGVIR